MPALSQKAPHVGVISAGGAGEGRVGRDSAGTCGSVVAEGAAIELVGASSSAPRTNATRRKAGLSTAEDCRPVPREWVEGPAAGAAPATSSRACSPSGTCPRRARRWRGRR
jgi:hypothetical protein